MHIPCFTLVTALIGFVELTSANAASATIGNITVYNANPISPR